MVERAGRDRAWLVAAWLAVWELVARMEWVSPLFAASPTAILASMVELAALPEIQRAFLETVMMMIVAFAIASAAGILIGAALGLSKSAYRVFHPLVLLFFSIPKMIFLPLVLLIFGIGFQAKVANGVISAVFPIIVNVTAGVRMIDAKLLLAAQSMGATRAQTLRHVVVPGALPAVITGLWYGLKHVLLGVLIAELFVSQKGIGYWITLYTAGFKTDRVFALIVALAAVAIAIGSLWRRIEERVSRWRAGAGPTRPSWSN